MAVKILGYPMAGHVDDSVTYTATVTNSGNQAMFTKTNHGLGDRQGIYIFSNVSDYNGYWHVYVATAHTFFIYPYYNWDGSTIVLPSTIIQEYIVDATASYYISGSLCYWNSVHLPIVFTLYSDTWPINGVDTSRTITTFTNWNGYTYLVLNGDIKSSGTASSLENVILSGVTGVNGTTITGVYKIIQWFSDTNIVIDLAYNAGHVLSGGTCQYYYLNYHAKVKVYAGFKSTHTWYSQKPFELLSTERVTFDSNGYGKLNVADIVKSKINVLSNNLQLATLPNNIDAACQIYISIAESYDDSDMYTISEYTGSYTDMDYVSYPIYAINSKLPFKSRSSGLMEEYTPSNSTPQVFPKFLTPFTQPTLFVGYYFDISFIIIDTNQHYLKIDRYNLVNGNYELASSSFTAISQYEEGVYRYPLSQSSSEDRIDVTVYESDQATRGSDPITIDVVSDCDQFRTTNMYLTWLNYLGGFDYWLFTAQKLFSVDITENKTQEINIHNEWPKSYGEFADSITKQSIRKSKNVVKVTSQYLTQDQADALAWIVSSPLVQILTTSNSITTARTVLVDTSTLKKYQDRDNLFSVSFNITYTDELPAQCL